MLGPDAWSGCSRPLSCLVSQSQGPQLRIPANAPNPGKNLTHHHRLSGHTGDTESKSTVVAGSKKRTQGAIQTLMTQLAGSIWSMGNPAARTGWQSAFGARSTHGRGLLHTGNGCPD